MSVISIRNGLYKAFPKPISLDIASTQRWAVLGPKKASLLEILAAKHVPEPPTAQAYPTIGSEHWPSQVIAHVVFGDAKHKAPYVAARYESFRDEFDYSLGDVLKQASQDTKAIEKVVNDLHLSGLEDRWIVGLSNGQTRRAHLALALLKDPKILVIDDPFVGLDPENKNLIEHLLENMPIPVVMGLISAQQTPNWVTDIAVANNDGVVSGRVGEVTYTAPSATAKARKVAFGEPVIELKGLSVAFKGSNVFEDLEWIVRRGERVHVKGPNGSGKSTLLAVLTADHPQSWNEKVVLFGEPREVGKHSYHSINKQIGHSAPELHSIFPKWLQVRRAIGTGFTGDFLPPKLDAEKQAKVDAWIERLGLDAETRFGDLSSADQKLVLLARALVKDPEILILDEAFSTLDSSKLQLAFETLDNYDGTVLIVGHVPEEIPPIDSVLDLGLVGNKV